MRAWRCTLGMFIILLGMGSAQALAAIPSTGGEGSASLQLIADHHNVGAGGEVGLSILLETSAELTSEQTMMELKVPATLEVNSSGRAQWDPSNRSLSWALNPSTESKGWVDQVTLQVPEQTTLGTEYFFKVEASTEDGHTLSSESITVNVGTEVHQPFMQGYTDRTFRPLNELTRAETAAIVARMKGLVDYEDETMVFTDVPSDHWAYAYIRQVQEQGDMVGYDGEFRPDEPIRKAELIVLMLRLHGVMPVNGLQEGNLDFLPAEHWSADAIGTALALNLLPENFVTVPSELDQPIERQSAAQLISIGFKRGPLVDGDERVATHYPDVPTSHPFFHWIEEASRVAHEGEHHVDGERLNRYLPEQTREF